MKCVTNKELIESGELQYDEDLFGISLSDLVELYNQKLKDENLDIASNINIESLLVCATHQLMDVSYLGTEIIKNLFIASKIDLVLTTAFHLHKDTECCLLKD